MRDIEMLDLRGMSLEELRSSTDPALLAGLECEYRRAGRDGLGVLQNRSITPTGDLIFCEGQFQPKPNTCNTAY